MKVKNLKGYSKQQRELAYAIRDRVTNKLNMSNLEHCRVFDRVMAITSPMFFIKYRELLESGNIAGALSQYQDDNYKRRARFASGG